jgi:hypothetical protein
MAVVTEILVQPASIRKGNKELLDFCQANSSLFSNFELAVSCSLRAAS